MPARRDEDDAGGAPSTDNDRRKRAGQTARPRERVISLLSLATVLSAGGQSRLCASLRPLRGAENAALTNLPLRSSVASSYRKNVRNKLGPRK